MSGPEIDDRVHPIDCDCELHGWHGSTRFLRVLVAVICVIWIAVLVAWLGGWIR